MFVYKSLTIGSKDRGTKADERNQLAGMWLLLLLEYGKISIVT